MSSEREQGESFVQAYGRTWQEWDVEGFVRLFTEDVVYVAHPTEATVVGREALARYVLTEKEAQGEVDVRMGRAVVEGDTAVAEFWVLASKDGEDASIAGCLLARLDARGRCDRFREYWFDLPAQAVPAEGWGR